jgi:hypothetical protein
MRAGMTLAVVAALTGCGDASSPALAPGATTAFRVAVRNQSFWVRVSEPAAAAALRARLQSGMEGVISGELVAGDGGFNGPWTWHLAPATVSAPDVTTEVCDGRPSDVQGDRNYWVNTVGRFCPWAATVVQEDLR